MGLGRTNWSKSHRISHPSTNGLRNSVGSNDMEWLEFPANLSVTHPAARSIGWFHVGRRPEMELTPSLPEAIPRCRGSTDTGPLRATALRHNRMSRGPPLSNPADFREL